MPKTWAQREGSMYRDERNQNLTKKETFLKTCMTIKTHTALLSQEQRKHLYMKVDVNSKGEIGFDDFTSYLLYQQVADFDEPEGRRWAMARCGVLTVTSEESDLLVSNSERPSMVDQHFYDNIDFLLHSLSESRVQLAYQELQKRLRLFSSVDQIPTTCKSSLR